MFDGRNFKSSRNYCQTNGESSGLEKNLLLLGKRKVGTKEKCIKNYDDTQMLTTDVVISFTYFLNKFIGIR